MSLKNILKMVKYLFLICGKNGTCLIDADQTKIE